MQGLLNVKTVLAVLFGFFVLPMIVGMLTSRIGSKKVATA